MLESIRSIDTELNGSTSVAAGVASFSTRSSLPVAVRVESILSIDVALYCADGRLAAVGLFPMLKIAGSSNGFGFSGGGAGAWAGCVWATGGGTAFSFTASASSAISAALTMYSGANLPFVGHMTRGTASQHRYRPVGYQSELKPFRRVKLWPGSMALTTPRNCAPGGSRRVTSMVSPMNWFDMLQAGSLPPR